MSATAAGTLLLGIAGAAAEELAPVPLLALLKHPLVGGEGDERLAWLDAVRALDLKLRGPRPAAGIGRARRAFRARLREWQTRPAAREAIDGLLREPLVAGRVCAAARRARRKLSPATARGAGPAGRMAAELLAELQASDAARDLTVAADDAVPLLRQLLDGRAVRPPYGGHPRIFIWGLLEARLQRADLVVLGGLNEGIWPALAGARPVAAAEGPRRRSECRRWIRASALPRMISPVRSARPKC